MTKRNQYMYYIFVTPLGKGYGCFAIKSDEQPGSYIVSASFCHPCDQKLFRKTTARAAADAHREKPRARRLAQLAEAGQSIKVVVTPTPDEKGNVDTTEIVEMAIKAGVEMRTWALVAHKRGLFYRTLTSDNKKWGQMVCTLPNGPQLVEYLRETHTTKYNEKMRGEYYKS